MASSADQLTQPERRAHLRHKVHSPAYATTEESSSFILPHLNEIVDIGEDGICFQNSSPRELKEILPMNGSTEVFPCIWSFLIIYNRVKSKVGLLNYMSSTYFSEINFFHTQFIYFSLNFCRSIACS